MGDAGATANGAGGVRADTVPGHMVRELFEQHEREIESLLDELATARREADAVERRIREHPALGLLGPEGVRRWGPVQDPQPPTSGRGQVRTTVVHRPRRPVGSGAGAGVEAVRGDGDGARASHSRAVRAGRYSWAWKVGLALAVVGLLLLKFG